jgi:hypothetical protein
MGWWTALKGTMGTRRADRIARADADQLLAGRPAGHSHAGLAAVLAEASAPPRPAELAREAEAVAAFRRLRSAAPSIVDVSTVEVTAGGGRRRTAGPPWRGATLRLAIVVLVLAVVGTASITLAYRPVRMQPSPTPAASTSVPAPSPSHPSSVVRRTPPPGGPGTPTTAPSPAAFVTGTTGISDLARATQLCQVWAAAADKAVRDLAATQLGPLIGRLDGPNGLPAFCRKLIDANPGTVTTATKAKEPTPPATPAKDKNAKKGG